MSAPSGPVAYVTVQIIIFDDGQVGLQAYGCVMDPDGSLQSLGGSYQFAVQVPLAYGTSAATVQSAIGQAIATGYGGSAPSVVLLPSF